MVSVDVKHHVYVYFLRERRNCANREAKQGSNEVKWVIFCFSCSQQLILWTLSVALFPQLWKEQVAKYISCFALTDSAPP